MEKEKTKKLMKKMKKLRTWTEGVHVNPISYRVNNRLYYAGGFRKGEEEVASAYLTLDGEEVKEEVYEAQPYLSTFADISTNIFSIGKERLDVDTSVFTVPLSFQVDTPELEIKEGYEVYSKLLEFHQKIVETFLEYKNYYEHEVLIREEITISDVRKTQKTAVMINLYQYFNLEVILEKNAEIKAYASYLESTENWKKLNKVQRTFVKGITETKPNKPTLKDKLNSLEIIKDEDKEKMFQRNLDHTIRLNAEQMIKQQKYIRYPQ